MTSRKSRVWQGIQELPSWCTDKLDGCSYFAADPEFSAMQVQGIQELPSWDAGRGLENGTYLDVSCADPIGDVGETTQDEQECPISLVHASTTARINYSLVANESDPVYRMEGELNRLMNEIYEEIADYVAGLTPYTEHKNAIRTISADLASIFGKNVDDYLLTDDAVDIMFKLRMDFDMYFFSDRFCRLCSRADAKAEVESLEYVSGIIRHDRALIQRGISQLVLDYGWYPQIVSMDDVKLHIKKLRAVKKIDDSFDRIYDAFLDIVDYYLFPNYRYEVEEVRDKRINNTLRKLFIVLIKVAGGMTVHSTQNLESMVDDAISMSAPAKDWYFGDMVLSNRFSEYGLELCKLIRAVT